MGRNKLLKMGRRRFLERIATLGVGASTLGVISKEAYAETGADPQNEVVYRSGYRYTSSREREPTYEALPKDEWYRNQGVRDAMHRLQEQLAEFCNPELVSPGMESVTRNRTSELGLVVEYIESETVDGTKYTPEVSFDEVKSELPATTHGVVGGGDNRKEITGIPVEFRRVTSNRVSTYFDTSYRPVEGGCAMEGTGSQAFGTINAGFHSNDIGADGWITVGHTFGGTGTSHECHQPTTDQQIGYCAKRNININADQGFVKTVGPDSEGVLAGDDRTSWNQEDIVGTKSDTWISNHAGGSYGGNFQGQTTGRTAGFIERYKENLSGHIVRVTDAAQDGDSGGTMYTGNEDVEIIGTVFETRGGEAAGNTADESERMMGGYWVL